MEVCRLEARTTNWFSRDKGRISVAGLWCGHLGCTSRRSKDRKSKTENRKFAHLPSTVGPWSCAGWKPAPQFGSAETKGESAWRICGAAILAAHLGGGAVQAGSPHHNWAQPRQRANQRGGFVVRPSWLHISAVELCRLEARTTIGLSRDKGRISVANLWCGHLGCTSRPWSCAGWKPAPQIGSAETKGESAWRICGAAILAAHLGDRISRPDRSHSNSTPLSRSGQVFRIPNSAYRSSSVQKSMPQRVKSSGNRWIGSPTTVWGEPWMPSTSKPPQPWTA